MVSFILEHMFQEMREPMRVQHVHLCGGVSVELLDDADLSDFFYVWLKRSIGFLYPEHFSTPLTPKKQEAVMAAYRHSKNKDIARKSYETMMANAFLEAHRVLKPGAHLI